jgi:exonuclease III
LGTFKVKEVVEYDEEENYLLIKCEIKDQSQSELKTEEILVGVVYGPAGNEFFEGLRKTIENKDLPTILGGDFNTVLGQNQNPDLENRNYNIPNYKNGEIIRKWINGGKFCDPYRKKYPSGTAMSSFGFRTKKNEKPYAYGKSRLDFFIISESLFPRVEEVQYGAEPNKGFDHVEVTLSLRKGVTEALPLVKEDVGAAGGTGHSDNIVSELSNSLENLHLIKKE